jgi:hypothetical protein
MGSPTPEVGGPGDASPETDLPTTVGEFNFDHVGMDGRMAQINVLIRSCTPSSDLPKIS